MERNIIQTRENILIVKLYCRTNNVFSSDFILYNTGIYCRYCIVADYRYLLRQKKKYGNK